MNIKTAEFFCTSGNLWSFPDEVYSLVNPNEDCLVIEYYEDTKELIIVKAGVCDLDEFGIEGATNLRQLPINAPVQPTKELIEFLTK